MDKYFRLERANCASSHISPKKCGPVKAEMRDACLCIAVVSGGFYRVKSY